MVVLSIDDVLTRRGAFRSVVDPQAAINRYTREHNEDPKPFVWTKPADLSSTSSAGYLHLPFQSAH